MGYQIRYQYHIGRVMMSIAVIYMGLQMFQGGHDFYGPYMHAMRRTAIAGSKNKIEGQSFTFEDVNKAVVMVMGVLLMLGGVLTAIDRRMQGPPLIIIALVMMIALQDNPWIRDQVKPKPKSVNVRMNDFFRHLSLIGACLFVMFTPEADEEENEDAKKVKSD